MSDFSMTECVIEWIKGEKTASVTMPTNTRLNNKIRKLAKGHPEIVVVENKDGSIFAKIPVNWVRITPVTKKELTEEEKAQLSDRLRKGREKK